MDKVFSQFFSRPYEGDEFQDSEWSPRVDIAETEHNFTLEAELPGIEKDDIKITLQNDTITLRGEKKSETRQEGKSYHLLERHYGKFIRSFKMPVPINTGEISASFKNGVLTLILPKTQEAKPREIEIKTD
jgi:HSP20 family protein